MRGSHPPEAMSGSEIQRFSYGRTGIKIYSGFLLVAWILGLILWPIWSKPRGWMYLIIAFSAPGFVFLLILFVNFCLVSSDIEVGADGIGWAIFGWRWKEIKWADVDHIGVSSVWDFARYRKKKLYSLYRSKKPRAYFLRGGGIFFNENIHHVTELKSLLKSQVEGRGIRVEGSDLDS